MKNKLRSLFDEKAWKFLLVGILNTIVGNGLSFLLLNLVDWQALGLEKWSVAVSSGISTILASIMSYFLNRYFTFQYKGKDKTVMLRFAINIAVCYVLAYVLGASLMEWILSGTNEWIRKNGAMVFGMGLFVIFNYFGQRFFTFREKTSEEDVK